MPSFRTPGHNFEFTARRGKAEQRERETKAVDVFRVLSLNRKCHKGTNYSFLSVSAGIRVHGFISAMIIA